MLGFSCKQCWHRLAALHALKLVTKYTTVSMKHGASGVNVLCRGIQQNSAIWDFSIYKNTVHGIDFSACK